jgi:hypothetical protein
MEEPLLAIEQDNIEMPTDEDNPSDDLTTSTTHIPTRQAVLLRSIFCLLGVGILVPWNAFISAKPYFAGRFCTHEGDVVNVHLESYFSLTYTLSAILWLGGILIWQYLRDQSAAITESNDITLSQRVETPSSQHESETHAVWLVIFPLGLYVVVFLLQTLGVAMIDVVSPQTFEHLTLFSIGLCGMCGATATSGILATAGLFPSTIGVGPFMAGQSVGGVAVSLANFIAATWEDPEDYWQANCKGDSETVTSAVLGIPADVCVPYHHFDVAAFGYFLAGSLTLVASLCGYLYIDRYQRSRHRNSYETVNEAQDHNLNSTGSHIGTDLTLTVDQSPRVGLEMIQGSSLLGDSNAPEAALHQRGRRLSNTGSLPLENDMLQDIVQPESFVDEPPDSTSVHDHVSSHNETTQVWLKVQEPALCIYLVFTVTLALFPGWVSELRSVHRCTRHDRLDNDLYTPMAFVLFNCCDLLGRVLAGYVPVTRIRNLPRKLVTSAILRFLCFPLLGLCIGGSSDHVGIPSNLYAFVVQVLFATSNGFLASVAFIFAPTVLPPTTHVQERSAELLNFSLSFGLLSGSFLSFPVSHFLN